ncbi:MAG: BspA family leucine-rich repeat surface protein [Bacteroidaceae bacterium]|nr:BspA family leucine-rich repeat surface protein [Bacteroidaceae bacterium]
MIAHISHISHIAHESQKTHIAHVTHETHIAHETHKAHSNLFYFLILLFFNFLTSSLLAQDITVTVTPTQPILPPQVMLYITEPANYFNISLTNTGKDDANVYLVMQVEQVTPSSGLSLSTPARRQPKLPIVVPAGSTHILAPAEVRSLFNHIPLNEIQAPDNLFDNYANGSFGLLPEGQYQLHFTAYQWNLALADPVVASSPSGGIANFTVCYNAQAPEFLTPMAATSGLLAVADLNPMTPQFTWKAPVVACNPTLLQYTYSLRIVELLPGQAPDNSMDNNPVVYQASNLTTPMCMIPQTVIKLMTEGKTYAAQVTATSANVNRTMLNYVSIANNGKSTYKLFRLNSAVTPVVPDLGGGSSDDDDDIEDDDADEIVDDDEEFRILMGKTTGVGSIDKDSLYTYRNPVLHSPSFVDGGTRQIFTYEPIDVKWDPAWHIGGDGTNPDGNEFEYEVRIYNGGEEADREEAMKTDPIWKLRTKEFSTTVKWQDLEKNAAVGDYLVLEVKPIVTKGSSIAFTEDGNIKDFGINERLSKKYFQCEARVQINNLSPTSMSAKDLKGKDVWVGEYKLTIDDISGSGSTGFSGSGRVEWQPFGSSLMVCVTFDKLMINDDYIVYDGICVSAKAPEMLSSMEVVDKLFSDWGIDNLIGSTGLPYANKLQDEAKGKIKSLAEQANIGSYYKKLQDGKDIGKLLTTGKMDKVYMPVRFPESVLPAGFSAVDLQIADMKFAPTYATMNIIGEAILPECDVLKSKVLLFGAPRVCISPNTFLPESGQVALLGDFVLTPSADIEMTFKAPKDLLEPKDGCYISWTSYEEGTKLELLGVDIDMKIADLVKDVGGTPTDESPIMNLKASVGSWDDFLVDRVTIEDFQVKDLPGWTFQASDIVYDHSMSRNSDHMGKFPEGYDKKLAGCDKSDLHWQGLHIGKVGVGFPKSLELGDVGEKGDKRLWVDAKEMYWDQSGVTVTIGAENLFAAKEGTLGGWGISLDEAHVQIIQSDFDNAGFSGQINIPILKTATGDRAAKDDKKGGKGGGKEEERFGNVDYTCEIRSLTSLADRRKGERSRYSYVFLTENVGQLDFSFFVAQAELDPVQTYFVVEAYDDEKEAGKVNTQVELCMGGEIGIGLVDKANDWLEKKTKSLPLELKIPDIHFTKMRLSNVQRGKWVSESKRVAEKRTAREEKEQEVHDAALKILMEANEINIGTTAEPFYFDLGEWSVASEKKHLGPFSFTLDKFSPGYADGKVKLELGGTVGLIEDKIDVSAAVVISAKVNTKGSIKDWSIDDGDVEFRSLKLDLDFTAIHLKGELEATDAPNKGYKGTLDIGIIGFFNLDCEGGYFEHKKDEKDENDSNYSWGYFKATLETAALRFDPVVIDRISGGFFFNCRPTKGKNKFDGDPKAQKGCIGIAFGLGMCSSAGRETMSADLDMLVVYDTENDCFSTFMLNGKVEAVAGMVKANCSLIYENEMVGGKSKNRYLCLNVTVEAGADTKALIEKVTSANKALDALKTKMEDFQKELDPKEIYQRVKNPESGLNRLSGDYKKNKDGEAPDNDDPELSDEKKKEQEKKGGITALKTKISLELKITWAQNGKEYSTPKWHLYIGEPAKDKRCFFQFLKYDGYIVKVDIGADAYLCIGNELPDGGALPPIPDKITEFLSGHKADQADMGADLGKANRSRAAAAKKLLDPNSCNGGIMVGASAWGNIEIDLGLLYGGIDAIAGFDAALVNYGNNAFCVNSGSHMGYKGWYAMGQLYAYLAAHLGLHIHIGSFINEKIEIFNAGIGGVLELGLPNPTWIEGQARIKISLLGGLCKVNKKFEFSAGNHCVPFKGNALDGFEMFQGVSHGSDSLYQALMDPTFAISLNEAKNMTFTTQSSIGSHYRLVDPSWESELKDKDETTESEIEKSMALNASRTYVFDINKDKNLNGMRMGVRLFDLGEGPYAWVNERKKLSTTGDYIDTKLTMTDDVFLDYMTGKNRNRAELDKDYYNALTKYVAENLSNRDLTVGEASLKMQSRNINSGVDNSSRKNGGSLYVSNSNRYNSRTKRYSNFYCFLDYDLSDYDEVNVSFREDKGSTFHLSNMDLKPGHSYMLVLAADAYEIRDGQRVWCEYYSEKDRQNYNIHWRQNKAWFFRIKGEREEVMHVDSVQNLEPYVALAYPSTNGTRVVDTRGEGTIPAYYTDIMHPTIALNRDIRSSLPTEKMTWVLEGITAAGDTLKAQTRDAKYVKNGNCINLEPETAFREFNEFTTARNSANKKTYDFTQEQYHLRLLYTYNQKKVVTDMSSYDFKESRYNTKEVEVGDSTVTLVDLCLTPLPHHIMDKKVDGEWYTADNWLVTTTSAQTEPVAYSKPFVGGTIDSAPTIEYEKDYYNAQGTDLLTDEEIVFKNKKYAGIKNSSGKVTTTYNLPYRLIDPYLYFAYLGKWVFIGDREISDYSFDNMPVKFGSESLIFNYNGTVVNSEFLKDKRNKSLLQLRKQMYDVWNTWNYNDSNHPKYPLPNIGTTVGGLTAANQDGKASTVTPLNINYYTDYTYVFGDLVKDYLGAYNVAQQLCSLLKTYSGEIAERFYYYGAIYDSFKSSDFDNALNNYMKGWNGVHRGQYIEVSDRGYTVRVPFYQLPLIYGDCFGAGAKFANQSLSRSSRTFSATIGEGDMKSGDPASSNLSLRWSSAASNLLFFRLNDYGNQSRDAYGYNPLPFKYFEGNDWSSYSSCYKNSTSVEHDQFDVHKSLQAVTGFKARLYRVDSYDTQTGQYTVSPAGSHCGGGPWERTVNIGTGNSTASNMDKMYNEVQAKDVYLYTHYDEATPQVIWCSESKSLIFRYSNSIIKRGDVYRTSNKNYGRVSSIYIGAQATEKNWRTTSIMDNCTNVIISKEFRDGDKEDFKDLQHFFEDFKKLQNIEGLEYLITDQTTKLASMFTNCESLTSLDFSKVITQNVTSMSHMFDGCTKLKSIDLSKFNTSKVEHMNSMFEGCTSLTSLDLSNFTGDATRNTSRMFADCSNLTSIDLSNVACGGDNAVVHEMFYGCNSLRKLNIDTFNPKVVYKNFLGHMFVGVSDNLTCRYFSSLDERIVSQIPGTKKAVPDQRAKVIYGRLPNTEEVLLFVYSSTDYVVGKSYEIKVQYLDYDSSMSNNNIANNQYASQTFNVYVKGAWKGEDVVNSSGSPKWKVGASTVNKIYIDKDFDAKPNNTSYWFNNFSRVTEIHGLPHLNTSLVTNMRDMFSGCSSLKVLGLGFYMIGSQKYPTKFNVSNVTSMAAMFSGCTSLERLNLNGWSLSRVTSMFRMFENCSNLIFDGQTYGPLIDGSSNVTDMDRMFSGCAKLECDGSKYGFRINTDKVTDMYSMFKGCTSMAHLPLLSSTANVTRMSYMFNGCTRLENVDLSVFNTEKVKSMDYMFAECSNAKEIDLSKNNFDAVTSASNMFSKANRECFIYIPSDASKIVSACPEASFPNRVLIYPCSGILLRSGQNYELFLYGYRTTLKSGDRCNISPYSGYTVETVFSGSWMQNRKEEDWYDNRLWSDSKYNDKIKKVTIHSSFKNVKIMNAYCYFWGLSALEEISGIENLDISKAKSLYGMFLGCMSLKDFGGTIDVSSATDLTQMFSFCASMEKIPVKFGSGTNITSTSAMFHNCFSLKEIPASNYPHTDNVTDFSYMFFGCSNLVSVPTHLFNTSKATTMNSMFYGCTSLNEKTCKGIKEFDTKNVKETDNMMRNTPASELDLSAWNTSSLESMDGMFAGCTSLRILKLGSNWDISKVGKGTKTFQDVNSLAVMVPKAKLITLQSDFTSKQGFKIGTTGDFLDENASQTPQVIWTKGNKTLTFYYGLPAGSTFNGQTVTQKWSGDAVLKNTLEWTPWTKAVKADVTNIVIDKTFANARPTSTKGWFRGCEKVKSITGLENLCTVYSVTDMSYMFSGCKGLTELVFDNSLPLWGTNQVTTFSNMFGECTNLKKLVLTRFSNTSKVTSMYCMFYKCSSLETLDVSMMTTEAVTNANYLFYDMGKLRQLTVGSGFNFPKLSTKASYAFSYVSKCEITAKETVLNSVKNPIINKLGFIEKSGGTNGEFMASDKKYVQAIWTSSNKTLTFYYGKQYKAGEKWNGYTITNVWNFSGSNTPWLDTVKGTMTTATIHESMAFYAVTSCANWFKDCTKLTTVNNLTNLKTSSCLSFYNMFRGCKALTRADVSKFLTSWGYSATSSNKINLSCMFYECESLSTIDVSGWTETARVSNMAHMFWHCKAVTRLDLSKWKADNCTAMNSMFSGCEKLTNLSINSNFNSAQVTTMAYMFYNCKALTSIPVTNLNTQSVKDMSYMFYGCEAWTASYGEYNPWRWETGNATTMEYMFYGCKKITSLNLSSWNTSNVTSMLCMFYGCEGIKETSSTNRYTLLNVENFNVSKVTNMASMFSHCTGIKWLKLGKWKTSALINMLSMFSECNSLREIDISNFTLAGGTAMNHAFYNCNRLQTIDMRMTSQWSPAQGLTKEMFKGATGQVLLNSKVRVTTNNKDSGIDSHYVIVGDCNSGTNKTNMVTTLVNLGKARNAQNKMFWYKSMLYDGESMASRASKAVVED